MIDENGKLTSDGKTAINQALRELNKAVELTRRKMACGDDCEKHQQDIQELIEKLTAYKEQFGKSV